jgi:hypothetical protein
MNALCRHHRASLNAQKAFEATTRIAEMKKRADPWRRMVHPPPFRLHDATRPDRELTRRIVALVREAMTVEAPLEVITLENVLEVCCLTRRLRLPLAMLEHQTRCGAPLLPKTILRAYRMARAAGEKDMLEDLRLRFLDQQRLFDPRRTFRIVDDLQSMALRHEFVGALVDQGEIEAAVRTMAKAFATGEATTEGDRGLLRAVLVPAVPRDPLRPVAVRVRWFLDLCMATPECARLVVDSLDDWAEPVLHALAVELDRLADRRHLLALVFEHGDDPAMMQRLLHLGLDAAFAHAFEPGLADAAIVRDRVQAAVKLYDEYAGRHGPPPQRKILLRLVDGLALIGQHTDALALAASWLQTHDSVPHETDDGTRATLNLVHAALGLHIPGAIPTLRHLLEAAFLLFARLAQGAHPKLSTPLLDAFRATLATMDPAEASLVLDEGANAEIAERIARSAELPIGLPCPVLSSRAPGMTIPADDPLLTDTIDQRRAFRAFRASVELIIPIALTDAEHAAARPATPPARPRRTPALPAERGRNVTGRGSTASRAKGPLPPTESELPWEQRSKGRRRRELKRLGKAEVMAEAEATSKL